VTPQRHRRLFAPSGKSGTVLPAPRTPLRKANRAFRATHEFSIRYSAKAWYSFSQAQPRVRYIRRSAGTWTIEHVATLPQFRSQGLARRLLSQ